MLDAFLVTGLPGSGKTTVSRELAQHFPRSAHIEGDVLSFDFVVRGLPDPFGDDEDRREWGRQMLLRGTHICMLAKSFQGAGFVVVIDDFVTCLGDVVRHIECLKRPLGLVVLAPPLDVITARDARRDKHVFEAWKHKDAEMRAELRGRGVWIEDPDLTPAQIASSVLANLRTATVTTRLT